MFPVRSLFTGVKAAFPRTSMKSKEKVKRRVRTSERWRRERKGRDVIVSRVSSETLPKRSMPSRSALSSKIRNHILGRLVLFPGMQLHEQQLYLDPETAFQS